MDANQPSFEERLDSLELSVKKLESGGLSLEEAIQCYEEGMRLSASLQKQLAEAQRKVDVLRQGTGGEYFVEPLGGGED